MIALLNKLLEQAHQILLGLVEFSYDFKRFSVSSNKQERVLCSYKQNRIFQTLSLAKNGFPFVGKILDIPLEFRLYIQTEKKPVNFPASR